MKFRIVKRNSKYIPQVCGEVFDGFKWYDEWVSIGIPDGCFDIEDARAVCRSYEKSSREEIVDEFEL